MIKYILKISPLKRAFEKYKFQASFSEFYSIKEKFYYAI